MLIKHALRQSLNAIRSQSKVILIMVNMVERGSSGHRTTKPG